MSWRLHLYWICACRPNPASMQRGEWRIAQKYAVRTCYPLPTPKESAFDRMYRAFLDYPHYSAVVKDADVFKGIIRQFMPTPEALLPGGAPGASHLTNEDRRMLVKNVAGILVFFLNRCFKGRLTRPLEKSDVVVLVRRPETKTAFLTQMAVRFIVPIQVEAGFTTAASLAFAFQHEISKTINEWFRRRSLPEAPPLTTNRNAGLFLMLVVSPRRGFQNSPVSFSHYVDGELCGMTLLFERTSHSCSGRDGRAYIPAMQRRDSHTRSATMDNQVYMAMAYWAKKPF